MSGSEIDKLADLGSLTEEQLALGEAVGRAGLTMTALAIAIHVLSRVPSERHGGDLKAMKLLFHELAEGDEEVWQERAAYLLDGEND